MAHRYVSLAVCVRGFVAVAAVVGLGCGGRAAPCDPDAVGCSGIDSARAAATPRDRREPPAAVPPAAVPPAAVPQTAPAAMAPSPPRENAAPPVGMQPGPSSTPTGEVMPAPPMVETACTPPDSVAPSEECFAATPMYPRSRVLCGERWCDSQPLPALTTCERVAVSFFGAYHYRLSSADYDADILFIPSLTDRTNPVPQAVDFDQLQLSIHLGETADGAFPITAQVQLGLSDGLAVVDGTLVGEISPDAFTQDTARPYYQDGCRVGLSDPYHPVPGECACAFDTVFAPLSVYVPLGPLF